jgi:CHAT domain
LPDAFLAVGARAVFAAGTRIPDRAAGPFFSDLSASVRDGADPARALRDARVAALEVDPASWAADVILFELQ